MKRFMKISALAIALCSLFSFAANNHDVKSANAAGTAGNEKWSIIGKINDYSSPNIPEDNTLPVTYNKDNWKKDFDLKYNAQSSSYELAFTFDVGDEFKIRKDHKWADEGGVEIGFGGNPGLAAYLEAGENGNFKVKTPGNYLLKVADNDVANYGDKSYGLSLEPITTATFKRGTLSDLIKNSEITGATNSNVSSIIITNDKEDLNVKDAIFKQSCDIGENADQLTDDEHKYKIGCYYYFNSTGSGVYKLVIYANVDRIFASSDCTDMFYSWDQLTEIKFKSFDTSRVTDMHRMFQHCRKLPTLDLSMFNTSNVTNMANMFDICGNLTSINLSNFDTSKVTNMSMMFANCPSLVSLDLSSFDTSEVIYMDNMFQEGNELVEVKFSSKFNVGNVQTMERMFYRCFKLKGLDLTSFNPHNATSMCSMFEECFALEYINFGNFDTSSVTDMNGMFCNCTSLKRLDVSSFNTSNVISMSGMFSYCSALEKIDVSSFNTSNVKYMAAMFSFCDQIKEIKFFDKPENNTFVTNNVVEMTGMFAACPELTTVDVSQFDTTNVQRMDYMFAYNPKLENLDLSNFNTTNVTNMDFMFAGDSSLKSIDLSSFNTAKVESMIAMFYNCSSLEKLDISNFDFTSIAPEIETIDPSQADPSLSEIEEPTMVIVSGVGYLIEGATNLKYVYTPTTMREDISIDLPSQYASVPNGYSKIDSTTTNMILVPGSVALNELYNSLYALNPCTQFDQAPVLLDKYNDLSEEDKALFATLTVKDGANANDRLMYTVNYYAYKNPTAKSDTYIMTSINDSSSFLVVAIAMSSLAILGYYLIQKRKYAR